MKTTPKPTLRDKRVNAMILCIVTRDLLAQVGVYYPDPTTRANEERRLRKQLDEAHLIIERSLLKGLHLDHIDGVDRVYGIKRRLRTTPSAAAA